jgi:ketosteroid isomerase-like protein
MLSWMVKSMIRRAYAHVNAGEVEPVLKLFADDVTFTFPGNNRWGRTYNGKAEMETFIRELVALGLQFEVHDVLVKGPPWNTTVLVIISDRATDPDGRVVYENRAVEHGKARWGKIYWAELFEDTEKATAWDAHLSARA